MSFKNTDIKNNKYLKKYLLIILVVLIFLNIILAFLIGVKFYKSKCNSNSNNKILEDENVLEVVTFKEEMQDENIIGYITIESIGLNKAPIAEGVEMSTLKNYVGHFPESNYLDGNVALAGHNRGFENNYFENLKDIKENDIITYQTKSETKTYKVTEIKKIQETDVAVVAPSVENKITLITCVANQPDLRLCVIGIEI